MSSQIIAEKTAEAFASSFLDDTFGHELFFHSHIEELLKKRIHVIYQYIDDPSFFGAAVQHESGEEFVVLNTFHPVRIRYFTAAHELWHLTEGSQLQTLEFDHERAADRFAAAVMLPKALTLRLFEKFKNDWNYNEEKAILSIADLAGVPYESVERRLRELGKRIKANHSELDWKNLRITFDLAKSPLDLPMPETHFKEYVEMVREQVAEGLDSLTAANKLSYFAPEEAEKLRLLHSNLQEKPNSV